MGWVGYRCEAGYINVYSSCSSMIDLGANRFGLVENNGLESCRAADLINQIRFSQGRAYCLLVQFRILSERSSCVDDAEKCRLADEVKAEIRYLLNSFEAYKKMKEETRGNIECSFFGSYCATQRNIRVLLVAASELIGQQSCGF